jgi:DNA polymerase-3 subunit delta
MSNVYLFYGEEKYDLNIRVEKIKKDFSNLEIGVNLFYLNKENIDELSSIIESVTFFGTQKLIIIKDTKLKFDLSFLDKNLDEDIKIIIIEDSVDKRSTEYKKLSKVAECVEFNHMNPQEMITYAIQILKKYNINISHDTAEYFQTVCGEDKTNNINELQKLVIYLNPGDTVNKEIIDKVCSKTLNAKIFDVLNKIVNKETKEGIILLDEILQQKEPISKISNMLYKQVKQMYMIKYLKENNEKDIATKLGIHPFVFKNLSYSCDKYTLESLRKIIYDFDEYDEKTKNGEIDFDIGLKKIICSM